MPDRVRKGEAVEKGWKGPRERGQLADPWEGAQGRPWEPVGLRAAFCGQKAGAGRDPGGSRPSTGTLAAPRLQGCPPPT